MSKPTTTKKNKTLEKIMLLGLCILLFFPPFFRGLFFEKELLPTHIFSFALAIIWVAFNFKNKNYKLIKTPTDILALGVVLMYLISIFYAVNTRLAILEAFKYMNYFVIYLLARDIVCDENKNTIFNVLIASAFFISIIGIGSAIGTWNYNGAFVSNRINSTFQYPNTLASYLGAIFIITISIILRERNKKLKSAYSFLSSIILLTFILTYSRGMWLIFPMTMLAYIILLPNNGKLEAFLYIIVNVIVSTPLAILFAKYLDTKPNECWLIVICVGLLAALLTYIISNREEKLRKIPMKRILIGLTVLFIGLGAFVIFTINSTTFLTLENTTNKDKWISIIREIGDVESNKDYKISIGYNGKIQEKNQFAGRIAVQSVDEKGYATKIKDIQLKNIDENEVIEVFSSTEDTESLRILLQNYYKGTSISFSKISILDEYGNLIKNIPLKYKYIPEDIVTRINSLSLKETSSQARLAFYNDSMNVIKDYLLLGSGGGGWNTLYKIYQSYDYYTTQAHNYYLQMWIEVGLVGLVLFISFILLITYSTIKLYKQNEENDKIMVAGVYLAVLSILVHAFMDFDLSLSALTFVLWFLFGILANLNRIEFNSRVLNYKYTKYIFVVVLSVFIITSSSFMLGNTYAQKAINSIKIDKDLDSAVNYFEKASKLYPYKPEYKLDLANLYKRKYNEGKKKEDILRAKELSENAVNLTQYESKYVLKLASFYFSIGEFEKGLDLLDKSIKLQPTKVENYLQKSKGYLSVLRYYLNQQKDIDKVNEVIERAYKIKDEINQINEVALRPLKYNEELLNNLGFIQFYHENFSERDYSLDKDYVLKFAYYFDLDIDNDDKIDKLKMWNSKEGNISYEFKSEENSCIRIKNSGQTYGVGYLNGLKLKADTNYKIYFKARGTVMDKTFGFHLRDNKSTTKNQGGLSDMKLNNNWSIFSCEIKTTSDLDTESPYLGFFHYGKDSGYVDIEEVLIFEKK